METVSAKQIVTKTKNPNVWFGIDFNMNIYRGCCHGCIYCDSRSECYGIDRFDVVKAKENAVQLIRDELRRKMRTGVVGTGAMSDPYNPFEAHQCLTRQALELINTFGFGASVATKSPLLVRDADILKEIAGHSPVICKMTVTTADDKLSKIIEPGAAVSSKRFEAIAELSAQGLFAGILLMPVLPFLEDSVDNIKAIISETAKAGGSFIYPAFGVTLRDNQRVWYFDQLNKRFPGEGLVQKYIESYGNNYNCTSANARELWQVFTKECELHNIKYRMKDIIAAYKKPYQTTQLSLFDL